MSAQAKTAPSASFSALERADWRGVMDLDPQEEPTIPEKAEEKDWRDLSWEARRSITNAERCEHHGNRRINLMAAREQIDVALRLLCE